MFYEPPGAYKILETVARDFGGGVYKAEDLLFNRLVLLRDRPIAAHTYHEAQAVASLQHPNIVQLHAVLEYHGRMWLVMEFVGGPTLAEKLGTSPWPALDAARVMEKVARAVNAIHRGVGFVRPELTLHSIRFTDDQEPKAAVSAEFYGDHSDVVRSLGVPAYVAPEWAAGGLHVRTPAMDIFSLGVILYSLLTGQMPFRGDTALDTLEQVRTKDPVRPRRVNAHVPREMERICLKCLRKDPQERYPTAEALAEDLHCFQNDRVAPGPCKGFWRRWMGPQSSRG
jgi:serine/threonine protein kinase